MTAQPPCLCWIDAYYWLEGQRCNYEAVKPSLSYRGV
jgi:hypothetical protein